MNDRFVATGPGQQLASGCPPQLSVHAQLVDANMEIDQLGGHLRQILDRLKPSTTMAEAGCQAKDNPPMPIMAAAVAEKIRVSHKLLGEIESILF